MLPLERLPPKEPEPMELRNPPLPKLLPELKLRLGLNPPEGDCSRGELNCGVDNRDPDPNDPLPSCPFPSDRVPN